MVDLIVGGSNCQVLAKEVDDELHVELARVVKKRFPDGEFYLRLDCDIKDREVGVIQSTSFPQDSSIFELLSILELLKREGAREITAVVPYFGYSRQDRSFSHGEAVTSKVEAELISSYADRFISLNLHENSILEYFDIEAREEDATPVISEYYRVLGVSDALVISPDQGAFPLAKALAKQIKAGSDYLEKERLAPGKVEVKPKNLDVQDRNVILYDDIIDSGGSMVEATKMLIGRGSANVLISCVHPVLSNNAVSRLFTSGIADLAATNTIPSQVSFITVSSIIAEALK